MTPARVAIAGLPGSGKTTAARFTAAALGLPVVSAGQLFRAIAEERGLTLAQLSALAERDASIDRALDRRVAHLAQKAPAVLEGRLVAWVCREFRIPAFKVWLAAPERVRAERVAKRDGQAVERALEENRRRERSERTRYLRYYGVDIEDAGLYDLVLDTSALGAEEVARRIAEGAGGYGSG